MKPSNTRFLSLTVLLAGFIFISVFRLTHVTPKEISWDILGYYMYLPATFIHDDPGLKDISWLKQVNEEKQLAGTLYMVSSNEKGEPMYFFLMGMSVFYSPFFLSAHAIAPSIDTPPVDGFGETYVMALIIGGLFYTLIGLIYFRKILLEFMDDRIAAFVILLVIFGTNYIHHLTIDNLATINVLFMLCTLITWNTIQWHKNFRTVNLVCIGVFIALMTLVKPSEILIALLPLLWNVNSLKTFGDKIRLLAREWKSLLLAVLFAVAIIFPQCYYWHMKTGQWIYDSYKNPGVGLDLLSPHFLDTLFSYRKGWLLYTPVAVFCLAGFYFLYKGNKKIFLACFTWFCVAFYIITSWSEWWYGAGFSIRPLIVTYPILGIALGYFLQFVARQNRIVIVSITTVCCFFIFLNQFQWWQMRNYVLDPYRMTKEYYWATFLDTSATEEDRKLLDVYRDFSGEMRFEDKSGYQGRSIIDLNFENEAAAQVDSTGNHFTRLEEGAEFYEFFNKKYNEVTSCNHAWIEVSFRYRYPEPRTGELPCGVICMNRKEGPYGYLAPEIKSDVVSDQWQEFTLTYLTPEIRNKKDKMKSYIWNRGGKSFDIDDIRVTVYEKNR